MVDREKQVNKLKEQARNEPKLGQAFIATNKPLCHGLGIGWWPKRKRLVDTHTESVLPSQPGYHRLAGSEHEHTAAITLL